MNRNVVNLRADAAGAQVRHDLLAAHSRRCEIDQDHVEMQRWIATWNRWDWANERSKRSECGVVRLCQLAAPRDESVELAKLVQAKRALYITEPIIEANLVHFIVPAVECSIGAECSFAFAHGIGAAAHAVIAMEPHASGERHVIGCYHAAFSRRDRLDRMKREGCELAIAAIADLCGRAVGIDKGRVQSVTGVFDDGQTSRPSDSRNRRQRRSASRKMNDRDRLDGAALARRCVERMVEGCFRD